MELEKKVISGLMRNPINWEIITSFEYTSPSYDSQGEAFVKIIPGLIHKSRHECFAPTEILCVEQLLGQILRRSGIGAAVFLRIDLKG